ncbi:unnamed protein product [Prunus armeniaca]
MEGCSYYLAMVLVQLIYGGSNILIKFSLAEGLNPIVFVFYRGIRKQRPSLSFSVAAKIFVLALFGTTIYLNVYYAGLAYTSPTVACALSNVIPSLKFLMAVLLGLEKLKIRTARGQAKVAGTLFCIGGKLDQGAFLILTSHIAWSAWLIVQAVVSKVYTARLSLTMMICFFVSLQSSFLDLFFARNPISWRLEWNLQLSTIAYCGVAALAYYLQTWCISYKGPVFAAMFIPLQVIIVALYLAISFAERLHFGSGDVQLDRSVSHYCGPLLCAVGKEGKTLLLLNRQRMETGYLKTLKCWRMIFQS